MNLLTYLPIDRYRALNRNVPLPDRTTGTALFADISGFTPLSEKLVAALGPRRGAEEISHHLNTIYEALIECVHRYQGSVISFSGDAITCWFDGPLEDTTYLAATAGSKMQQAMAKMAHLEIEGVGEITMALKVAIAAGPVRRLVVGDPSMQLLDVLAGATVERMAQAEHFARPGDIVLTAEVYAALGQKVEVEPVVGQTELFLLKRLVKPSAARFWDELVFQPEKVVPQEQLESWVLPAVYARLKSGMSEFLTELRSAVVFFLRFEGLDYDGDDQAGVKLDQFIRWAQAAASAYDGNLLDLIIGDKGSYIYFAFGAPVAHQNEVERALRVTLTLKTPPAEMGWIQQVGIGVSQGTLRTGVYGCSSRHTYGVLGDEVNLAARLMQQAEDRQILVSQTVQEVADPHFSWQSLPPLKIKGKTEPVEVYSLLAEVEEKAPGLSEPDYRWPMIGRMEELSLIAQRIGVVLDGYGQVVAISGEAGLGKSRLVAEVVKLATGHGLLAFGGAAQSYGTQTPYLAWQPIWRQLVGFNDDEDLAEQIEQLAAHIEQINPALLPRLPLLGTVLSLAIPDNELTSSLTGSLRKASLESLLVDYLKARASNGSILLVVEDCHWLDPLSADLLESLARAIVDLPVLLLIAYRRAEAEAVLGNRITRLTHCTEIPLNSLSVAEMTRLIELRIGATSLPVRLVHDLIAQAEGNPFYLEELVNFLLDKAVDWQAITAEEVELPTSLYKLVLSRLDQLNEVEKSVLKVASVVGRSFKANWLWEVYPAVGEPAEVLSHLEKLDKLDLTMLNKSLPDMEYLFKHIVTRDVTYESLSHATRLVLHEQVAAYIERTYQTKIEQYLDLLAYHYERTLNQQKQREYLLKAAEVAQAAFSNQTALDYYNRLLLLLPENEQIPIKLQICQILELINDWPKAIEIYQALLQRATKENRLILMAQAQAGLGVADLRRGYFAEACKWLDRARLIYISLDEKAKLARVLLEMTDAYWRQTDFVTAHQLLSQSLAMFESINDQKGIASAINRKAQMFIYQDNYLEAGVLLTENLARRRVMGDKRGLFVSLNNLAIHLYHNNQDHAAADILLKEALEVVEETGDRLGKSIILDNLAVTAYHQSNYLQARRYLHESLYVCRELNINNIAFQLAGVLVGVLAAIGLFTEASRLAGGFTTILQNSELTLEPPENQIYQLGLQTLKAGLAEASFNTEFEAGLVMSLSETFDFALQLSGALTLAK